MSDTTAFAYRNGVLCAGQVPLDRIAQAVGTPTYVYNGDAMVARYRRLATACAALPLSICYATKANGNQAVIATLARAGAGADVVSAGEIVRALAAGVSPDRIVFSGVGKTADEMAQAIDAGIAQFNVESVPELDVLNAVASAKGATVTAALRVNPDVDAKTHAKITTGKAENKFGIDVDAVPGLFAHARTLAGVELTGLAVHIGSQIASVAPFVEAFRRVAALTTALRDQGHAIDHLDLGGGFGIDYTADEGAAGLDLDAYAAAIADTVGGLGCQLTIEPGRWLVGPAGVLLARVIYNKAGTARRFIVLDAAMNDLLRPSLYDAHHEIMPVRAAANDETLAPVDVVGPVCESGDTFARNRPLPPLDAGDLVAFRDAGAYGAVMSSTYNARPLAAEALVSGDDFAVVRPRQTIEDLIAQECVPSWLDSAHDAPNLMDQPNRHGATG